MKYVKTLGLATLVAAALMAFVGSSTASATVLCKVQGTGTTTGTTCPAGEAYPAGTVFKMQLIPGTKSKLQMSFATIECSKSSYESKTSAEEAEEITGPEGVFTFSECNCEMKMLKAGTLSAKWTAGTHNGTFSSTGTELTTTCSTIFGSIHCIFKTSGTDLGTLTGGNPAKVDLQTQLPTLPTNALCSEEAVWTAEYEFTSPKPLYVAGHT